MEQLPLPFAKGSRTSKLAAQQAQAKAPTIRERVFRVIEAHGPISDQGICEITGLDGNTVRPRRLELFLDNRIEKCRIGTNRAGRKVQLWQATRKVGRP